MDFAVFTQKDLSYLDDIMPEFVKRSREDGDESDDIELEHNEHHGEKHAVRPIGHFIF